MAKDGTIEYANPSSCQLLGFALEDLIGQNPRLHLFDSDSDNVYQTLWRTVDGGNVWKGTLASKRRTGEVFWQSTIIAPIVAEQGEIVNYLAISDDVTEKQHMQRELSINETRLKEIAVQSRTVIWETDMDGRYTYVSPVSEMVYGYAPQELIGVKTVFDLYPEKGREEFRKFGMALIGKGESLDHFDNPIQHKSGRLVWVSTSAKPIYDENRAMVGYRGVDFDIDRRKQDELELLKFKSISDQANYGNAITNMEGTIMYLNTYFASMHGYTIDELIGKNLSMFHSPQQLPVVRQALGVLKQQGEFTALEIWRARKDGTVFPSLMNAKIILDSEGAPTFMIANAIDITEIKQKESAIRRLEIAIEQSPVAMVITDLDAIVTYTSPAFSMITGYSADEVLGKKISLIKSGLTDSLVYEQLWQTIQAGKIWKGELINRRKNGELYHESMSITPVTDVDGHIVSYLAIKDDVTDQFRMKEEKIARMAAEEANQSKSMFLSNMSHEIRTPLNAIIGFAQVLETDKALSEKQRSHIQTISSSSRHLLELINGILDLSKIEAGKLSFTPGEFSIQKLLFDLEAMFAIAAEKKGLHLEFNGVGELPACVFGDEGKLRQVLINIIGNAIKFTVQGSVSVRILLETTADGDQLHFEVHDTGPGIPAKDVERIFDSFIQANVGLAGGGTGLGLTISKKLVQIMGGQISVTSRVGAGSIFSFQIPVTRLDGVHGIGKDPVDNVAGIVLNGIEYRILVVDDSPVNRELLRVLLEPLGFSVVEAVNGKEAIETTIQCKPHLILMDLRMPVMDGYEATVRINAMHQAEHIPIIAVTASAFEDDERAVLAKGFDGYLRKPFRKEDLLSQLGDKLGLRVVKAAQSGSSDKAGKRVFIQKDALRLIPSDLLEAMRLAVDQGDMVGFKTLIGQLGKYSFDIGGQLMELAKAYDYETLLEVLNDTT